jgi:hypothetical protein
MKITRRIWYRPQHLWTKEKDVGIELDLPDRFAFQQNSFTGGQ